MPLNWQVWKPLYNVLMRRKIGNIKVNLAMNKNMNSVSVLQKDLDDKSL